MPEAIEPQLDELRRRARRRLVGAVVLALAAAVLVPMLLESDPKPLGEDVSVKIPPIDDGKFENKLGEKARPAEPQAAPKSAPVTTKPASETPPAPATGKDPAPPVQAAAPSKPATDTAPKAASSESPPAATLLKGSIGEASKPTSASPATTKPTAGTATNDAGKPTAKAAIGAFSVQLAAYADDKGANALANQLKKAGHPAYTEPYATSRGTLWRVRVGPYATRDAAEAARAKLKAEGQSGIIAAAN